MTGEDEYEFDVEDDLVKWIPWLEAPLNPQYPWIRVLSLHPGKDQDPIVCDLQVVSLDEDPEYETLSYVWGDPSDTNSILIGGHPFDATKNLVEFLRCLRHASLTLVLWADAICIHQPNMVEKNQQLRFMSRIYRQATKAHIWFGHFTPSWTSEIKSGTYLSVNDLTMEHWKQVEDFGGHEVGIYLKAGGNPARADESQRRGTHILSRALTVLQELAKGKHFHEFPIYLDAEGTCILNRDWLLIQDCFEWLYSRSWWKRVWTVQEALLPHVDSIIHADPFSIDLSTLLDGFGFMFDHMSNCCMWTSRTFAAGPLPFRKSESMGFDRVVSLRNTRDEYAERNPPSLHLHKAIFVTRKRYATVPQDYFFGISALLDQGEQDAWLSSFSYSSEAAQMYNYCSKNVYRLSGSLSRLTSARGARKSVISGLSTWAIDLCANRERSADGSSGWDLFNASLRSRYKCPCEDGTFCEPGPGLMVNAVSVAKIAVCARLNLVEPMPAVRAAVDQVKERVRGWKQIYSDQGDNSHCNPAAFWRTMFGDRNVNYYHLHQREPLPATRTSDIEEWWEKWLSTGDHRDLTFDKKYNNEQLGDYHYRALELTIRVRNFFCTANGEPGLGSIHLQPSDEIFALQGSDSLAILRPSTNGEDGYSYIGPCFIDGWMYGKAVCDKPKWKPLVLY